MFFVSRLFLASFLKALIEFLDPPSPYLVQLVSELCSEKGHDQKEISKGQLIRSTYTSGKNNWEDQVLCIFVQFHEYRYEFNLKVS